MGTSSGASFDPSRPAAACCRRGIQVPDERTILARHTCGECKTAWLWQRDLGWRLAAPLRTRSGVTAS